MGIPLIYNNKKGKMIWENLPTSSGRWIKHPWNLIFIKGEMTLEQLNIIFAMLRKLQENINDALSREAQTLFPDEIYDEGSILTISVPLSEVTEYTSNYKHVEESAYKLYNMQDLIEYRDEEGTLHRSYWHLFMNVDVPVDETTKKRKGNIVFKIHKCMVEHAFKLPRYVNYIDGVISNFKKDYAARLYMYMKANSYYFDNDKGYAEWKPTYMELRELLGCRVHEDSCKNKKDKGTTEDKWIEKKYEKYKHFKYRILEPARKELEALAKENKIECYFSYEEEKGSKAVYEGGPEKICFKIYLTDFGRRQKNLLKESNDRCRVEGVLRNELNMKSSQIDGVLNLVTSENADYIIWKLKKIKPFLTKIKNVKKYVTDSIKNALAQKQESTNETSDEYVDYEEVKSAPGPSPSAPAPKIIENRCTEAVMKYWKHLIPQKEHSNYPEAVNELIGLLDNGLQQDIPGYDISKLENHLMGFCTSFADYPTPAAILNFIKGKEGIPIIDYAARTSSRYSSGIEYTHLDPRRPAPCPINTRPEDYE